MSGHSIRCTGEQMQRKQSQAAIENTAAIWQDPRYLNNMVYICFLSALNSKSYNNFFWQLVGNQMFRLRFIRHCLPPARLQTSNKMKQA
jgi:hypothetical protein